MTKFGVIKEGETPSVISGKPCTKIAKEEPYQSISENKPKHLTVKTTNKLVAINLQHKAEETK